eukprot:5224684-Amphidinium_carterae.1
MRFIKSCSLWFEPCSWAGQYGLFLSTWQYQLMEITGARTVPRVFIAGQRSETLTAPETVKP